MTVADGSGLHVSRASCVIRFRRRSHLSLLMSVDQSVLFLHFLLSFGVRATPAHTARCWMAQNDGSQAHDHEGS